MGKILVVDDEPQVRDVIKNILETAGHFVDIAADGDVAIKMQHQNPSELIILDMYMPEKEGVETLVELLTESPDLKILAMSGGGTQSDLTALRVAGRLGAKRTLTKPVTSENLLSCVSEILTN